MLTIITHMAQDIFNKFEVFRPHMDKFEYIDTDHLKMVKDSTTIDIFNKGPIIEVYENDNLIHTFTPEEFAKGLKILLERFHPVYKKILEMVD